MDEDSWNSLLTQIRDDYNQVVPVIGSRLLLGPDGSSLTVPIAQRLLAKYGVPAGGLPPFRELNEAVVRIKAAEAPGSQRLYEEVHAELRTLGAAGDGVIPEPLRQLAEIADFRLIVTLTPDDLLARSLRRCRSVKEIVHSPNLPSEEGDDLPADWLERSGEVFLLYLFGKSRPVPTCAIDDEDVLEYAHNIIAKGSHVPTRFLGDLRNRSLLLIGCNFPDWLSRFMLRVTNKKRLSEERYKPGWMVEPLTPEASLTVFLRTYSKSTEILSDMSPAAFVAELHRRWTATRAAAPLPANAQPIPPKPMFFVSYSRQTDQSRALSVVDALVNLGVSQSEIWYDKNTLEPGNEFQNRIFGGIRGCTFFLPLLSHEADGRREAFVFQEWRAADERRRGMNGEFIIPIVVDTEFKPDSYTVEPVPAWSEKLDFGYAPGGVPDQTLEQKLKRLVRSTRSRSASGVD